MRQVLESQFAIVYSAGNAKQLRFATYLANLLQMTGDSVAQIISDGEPASDFDGSVDNAIFLGGPGSNKWAARLLDGHGADIAIEGSGQSIRVGPCVFSGPGLGMAALVPFGSGKRLALVIDGTDDEGMLDAVLLGTPTIPPMVRQP